VSASEQGQASHRNIRSPCERSEQGSGLGLKKQAPAENLASAIFAQTAQSKDAF